MAWLPVLLLYLCLATHEQSDQTIPKEKGMDFSPLPQCLFVKKDEKHSPTFWVYSETSNSVACFSAMVTRMRGGGVSPKDNSFGSCCRIFKNLA